jgi:transketolase
MRRAFHEELCVIAEEDDRVFLMVGDLGFGEVEQFAERFPERFLNVGVAEQNMAGIACGLAMEGHVVVTYSIANFPILRCLEQIRNDICYHNVAVKIVSTGSGLAYGAHGVSHHNTEDLAIMRALPGMVVLCPADCSEARGAVRAMIQHPGPVYLRCGYKGEPDLHGGQVEFVVGGSYRLRDGQDVTLIGTGPITHRALLAVEILADAGIEARLLSMPSIKPIDTDAILDAARDTHAIVTIEEHNILGGLGGAVAEVILNAGISVSFKALGLPDTYIRKVGSRSWLLDDLGLAPESIAAVARRVMEAAATRTAGGEPLRPKWSVD